MKIIAKQNFKSNGVKCKPGYVLSEEDCQKIGALMSRLESEGMIVKEDGEAPASPPENEGMLSEGSDDLDGEEIAGSDDAPAVEEKPKKKKK